MSEFNKEFSTEWGAMAFYISCCDAGIKAWPPLQNEQGVWYVIYFADEEVKAWDGPTSQQPTHKEIET